MLKQTPFLVFACLPCILSFCSDYSISTLLSLQNSNLSSIFFTNKKLPELPLSPRFVMFFYRLILAAIFFISVFLFPSNAIRSSLQSKEIKIKRFDLSLQFLEAPDYQNGQECPSVDKNSFLHHCNPFLVHTAMTLDPEYLRGTIAAIHSVLKHASCPENIFFHFIASDSSLISPRKLSQTVQSAFPSLQFKVYIFEEYLVNSLISSSIRPALNNPLNYARSYIAGLLDSCIKRVIYLDSDVIVVDDIEKLWKTSLTGSRTIGAPEYCHVNLKKYFTNEFWRDRELSGVFEGKNACYFNTGVMVMNLERWRKGEYTKEIEKWMRIQKEKRIYDLGSLPPFLLVFGGEVESIDHKWNQHGLGGDNVVRSCRSLHPGNVSLIHWSGKGKPWIRLDENKPCPIDSLWAPYDLHKHHQRRRRQ